MHVRHRPVRHRFTYRVFFLLLDLDKLDTLAGRLSLFSHNRFGLLSLHDSDHGPRDGTPLKPWIEEQLRAAGRYDPEGKVFLACFPRMWGYVFNPLSVYYCYDRHGDLTAVLHEVRNTFGELHGYLLPVSQSGGTDGVTVRQFVAKDFYVSPFIPMVARYHFRLNRPGTRVILGIQAHFDGDLGLSAVLTGRRRPLGDRTLAAAVAAHPLMTLKVIAAIHWQALRLWLKRVPVRRRQAKMPSAVASVQGDRPFPNRRAS
jgi:DUF1365 family protein